MTEGQEPAWPFCSCGRREMEALARLACEVMLDKDEVQFRRKCGVHLANQIALAFSMDTTFTDPMPPGVNSNWKATGEYVVQKVGLLCNVAPTRQDFIAAALPKTRTVDQQDIDLVVKILATALEYGEIVNVEDLTVAGMQYEYHQKRGREPSCLPTITIDWRDGYPA